MLNVVMAFSIALLAPSQLPPATNAALLPPIAEMPLPPDETALVYD